MTPDEASLTMRRALARDRKLADTYSRLDRQMRAVWAADWLDMLGRYPAAQVHEAIAELARVQDGWPHCDAQSVARQVRVIRRRLVDNGEGRLVGAPADPGAYRMWIAAGRRALADGASPGEASTEAIDATHPAERHELA